jgi:peptide subunit release factor 1 (eRF1)
MLLAREPRPDSAVLSVYLDVDQTRPGNLNRGFEVTLDVMLRSLDQQLKEAPSQREFQQDAARVREFVSGYVPSAQSLCLFCDESEGFLWWRELGVTLPNDVVWSATPFVRPLLDALDEYERYGVILADRARARLFTVFLGEIEEHQDVFSTWNVHRTKSTGTDRWWSQQQFQRKAQVHVLWHLKRVAQETDRLAREHAFDRLVLAGASDVTAELKRLLPKGLRSRVVAELPLPIDAAPSEVLRALAPVLQRVERAHEQELVDSLLASTSKNDHRVVGLDDTVALLQEGRVWLLLYAEGFAASGWECEHCTALFSRQRETCAYCNGALRLVPDLVTRLVERAFEQGATVEQVRGEAAAKLRAAGGIGGWVRE